jgi:hypothetical protein
MRMPYPTPVLIASLLLVTACGQERAPIAQGVVDGGAEQRQATTAAQPGAQPEVCIDPAKIDRARMCTMDYTPVCGCDGQTHSNACKAANAGLTRWVKGACDATQ